MNSAESQEQNCYEADVRILYICTSRNVLPDLLHIKFLLDFFIS